MPPLDSWRRLVLSVSLDSKADIVGRGFGFKRQDFLINFVEQFHLIRSRSGQTAG